MHEARVDRQDHFPTPASPDYFYDEMTLSIHGFLLYFVQLYWEQQSRGLQYFPFSLITISTKKATKETSLKILAQARENHDMIARIADNTFVLLVPLDSTEIIKTITDRIRKNIPEVVKINVQSRATLPQLPHDYTEADVARALIALEPAFMQVLLQKEPREPFSFRTLALRNGIKIKIPSIKPADLLKPDVTVMFLAYAIPVGFFLYVLYWNFLPFGYNETFTIDVGSPRDTKVSEFYLEPSKDLGKRMSTTTKEGRMKTYRELNGMVSVVFKPKAVLKNVRATIRADGTGVEIIPPEIDFKREAYAWDYIFDFTDNVKPTDKGLTGSAYPFDGCLNFDGKSRIELPNSSDLFENGPFTIYVDWEPRDTENDNQQIIGHFNWEIFQNRKSITFRIGRMNDENGQFREITYAIDPQTFFHKRHQMIARYYPANEQEQNGYFELLVDNVLADRTYIGRDTIYKEYGGPSLNMSMGKSYHNYERYAGLGGRICMVLLQNREPETRAYPAKEILTTPARYIMITKKPTPISEITLHVR